MSEINRFDETVGQIAGAIYATIKEKQNWPPLLLVPPLTYKVRKILTHAPEVHGLSEEDKSDLAHEIQIGVLPLLFTFEIDASLVKKIAPSIEAATLKVLMSS